MFRLLNAYKDSNEQHPPQSEEGRTYLHDSLTTIARMLLVNIIDMKNSMQLSRPEEKNKTINKILSRFHNLQELLTKAQALGWSPLIFPSFESLVAEIFVGSSWLYLEITDPELKEQLHSNSLKLMALLTDSEKKQLTALLRQKTVMNSSLVVQISVMTLLRELRL